jgi:hypothetical protein
MENQYNRAVGAVRSLLDKPDQFLQYPNRKPHHPDIAL